MDSLLIIIACLSLILFVYNYFIYPAVIILVSKFVKTSRAEYPLAERTEWPTVSFIIAAYNEEKVIRNKILNTLALDYPAEKFQIIIVSDGSDDKTHEIVSEYAESGIIGLHEMARGGKSGALNRGVAQAKGDILVFSDANNNFSKDAIKHLVKHFADTQIGAVTGAKHIYENNDRQSSTGDGLYWKYESKIKEAESRLGSITGAEGEILAVRKSMFTPLDKNVINDDAAITFNIVKSGNRIIYEKAAQAYEEASIDLVDDFNVKVRMTAGGYQTLELQWNYLFPPRNWYAFSFISHKVLRWLAPHFLLLILLTTAFTLNNPYMLTLFVLQLAFYLVSFYGWLYRSKDLPKLVYIPMYFTVMNIALFWGFIRFLSRNTASIWKKAER